eukprot:6446762-Pyramimonas_sp.AAC.1
MLLLLLVVLLLLPSSSPSFSSSTSPALLLPLGVRMGREVEVARGAMGGRDGRRGRGAEGWRVRRGMDGWREDEGRRWERGVEREGRGACSYSLSGRSSDLSRRKGSSTSSSLPPRWMGWEMMMRRGRMRRSMSRRRRKR